MANRADNRYNSRPRAARSGAALVSARAGNPMDHPPFEASDRRRSGPGRWPLGLAGMVVLVAAIEAGLERGRGVWSSPTAAGFEWAYRSATADAGLADVVTLGDSVLKFGFSPRVFERASGRRADNWATVGNPPAVALSLLRAHLGAGGKPRAILVDFKPSLLGKTAFPELNAWARVATLEDGVRLAIRAGRPGFAIEFAAARAFTSYRDRWEIRWEVLKRLGGQPARDPSEAAARERNWRVNRGGHLLPPSPPPSTARLDRFPNEASNLRPDWHCLAANAGCLAELFGLAADRAIPVYWVITPIHPRVQRGRDELGLDAGFTRFVRDQAARAPGRVTVIDGRRLGLGPELFVDATHLDRRGALAFTAALAHWFAHRDPDDRWVDLASAPPELAARWGSDAEDTDASAPAIRRGEADDPTRSR